MNLLTFTKEVEAKLVEAGFECFVVGGYVRDMIMGSRQPQDIDLATDAKPNEILEIFNKYKTIDLGIEFGTVGINNGEQTIEITTYRQDIECDGRHAKVTYTDSLEEDINRRDFTINSLVYNIRTNEIIDLVGGIEDIKNLKIRTVGDPNERFREDYLRMLRACRFMALNEEMYMDPLTSNTIKENAHHIHSSMKGKLTTDRQRTEIIKGMKYPFPSRMIEAMKDTGLLKVIIPELQICIGVTQNKYHNLYTCGVCGKIHIVEDENYIEWKPKSKL